MIQISFHDKFTQKKDFTLYKAQKASSKTGKKLHTSILPRYFWQTQCQVQNAQFETDKYIAEHGAKHGDEYKNQSA